MGRELLDLMRWASLVLCPGGCGFPGRLLLETRMSVTMIQIPVKDKKSMRAELP